MHADPPRPQAEPALPERHTAPSQHPSGQVASLHERVMQVPRTHESLPPQLAHTAPRWPQLCFDEPSWQTLPSQHPVQFDALHAGSGIEPPSG